MMFERLANKIMGSEIEDLVLQHHDNRNSLYDYRDKIKTREVVVAPRDRNNDKVLRELHQQVNDVRVNYTLSEAMLEKAKAEQAGLISLVGLLSASIQAGRDTKDLENAIARVIGEEPAEETKEAVEKEQGTNQEPTVAPEVQNTSNDFEIGEFTVLEVRHGSSEGTIRAYCEAMDGTKQAIFGKNGIGKKLAESVGQKIKVNYRQGNKGLLAFDVERTA